MKLKYKEGNYYLKVRGQVKLTWLTKLEARVLFGLIGNYALGLEAVGADEGKGEPTF